MENKVTHLIGFVMEPVVRELMKLWKLLNYSCGKRLVAIMPQLVAKLECLQNRGNVAGT